MVLKRAGRIMCLGITGYIVFSASNTIPWFEEKEPNITRQIASYFYKKDVPKDVSDIFGVEDWEKSYGSIHGSSNFRIFDSESTMYKILPRGKYSHDAGFNVNNCQHIDAFNAGTIDELNAMTEQMKKNWLKHAEFNGRKMLYNAFVPSSFDVDISSSRVCAAGNYYIVHRNPGATYTPEEYAAEFGSGRFTIVDDAKSLEHDRNGNPVPKADFAEYPGSKFSFNWCGRPFPDRYSLSLDERVNEKTKKETLKWIENQARSRGCNVAALEFKPGKINVHHVSDNTIRMEAVMNIHGAYYYTIRKQ